MIDSLSKIEELFKMETNNKLANKIKSDFKFHFIGSNAFDNDSLNEIAKAPKKSNIITIKEHIYNTSSNNPYLIICMNYIIIMIEKSNFSIVQTFFKDNNLKIFILSQNIKNFLITNEICDKNLIYDSSFLTLLSQAMRSYHIQSTNKQAYAFWSMLKPCVIAYLIQNAFISAKTDRIKDYSLNIQTKNQEISADESDLLFLQSLHPKIEMMYHFESERIYICKKNKDKKILSREKQNLRELSHPLIMKYFGTVEENNQLILEYIDSNNLTMIEQFNLTEDDKLRIIFQLMIVIEYIHHKGYIYRDLKPNNVMLNSNKTVVLIDFDRAVKLNEIVMFSDDRTKDIGHCYIAPELCQDYGVKITYSVDVFSLGLMIAYIITGIEPTSGYNDYDFNVFIPNFPEKFASLKDICQKCIDLDPDNRPSISELIDTFYNDYFSKTQLFNVFDGNEKEFIQFSVTNPAKSLKMSNYDEFIRYWIFISESRNYYAQLKLGLMYYEGKLIPGDANKAIYFLTNAANNDFPEAQFLLGEIYYRGTIVDRDVNKSIEYLSKAANQNYTEAANFLGDIYFKGIFIKKDVAKGINYYKQAANRNNSKSLFSLGVIYYKGIYVPRDIELSIHYFSLSSDTEAYYHLAQIYYTGYFVPKDMNKAIHFFTLAADHGHKESQYNLSVLYLKGQYVNQNTNKAIHYAMLAAEQDFTLSQFFICEIYYTNEFVPRDINKSIHYGELAAKKNNLESQIRLGYIYYSGKYVDKDIKKAIYYYSLAAEKGDVESQFILGEIYYKENEFSDINKAIQYYSLAANQNHKDAQYQLGRIYAFHSINLSQAVHYFTLAANQGDVDSQFILGDLYDRHPRYKNINNALYYYTMAANQNEPKSQYRLGLIYLSGEYVAKDINKALYFFQISAKQNNVNALFQLGLFYYQNNDGKNAIYYYDLAAKQNDKASLINLAFIYYEGKLVPKNIQKAFNYFELAGKYQVDFAYFFLGSCFHDGKEVKKDINKAIHYFRLAANQNYSLAQYSLGLIYYNGDNVPRDIAKGIFYFKQAEQQNLPLAQVILGNCYLEGEGVSKDVNKALELYILAEKQNDPTAQYKLGIIYIEGQYVQQDISKGIRYLLYSSNQNFLPAQFQLGLLFYTGKYIQNINKSIHYFTLAAMEKKRKGTNKIQLSYDDFFDSHRISDIYTKLNPSVSENERKLMSEAQLFLAILYFEGKYVQKNIKKSLYLFEQSADNKNQYAELYLAFIYHEGIIVPKNIKKSVEYYISLSSLKNHYAKNNLAILYWKGEGVPKHITKAIMLFNEAINQNNDFLAMFNLANIYFYGDECAVDIDKSINLLIESINHGLSTSKILLCLVIAKTIDDLSFENINKKLDYKHADIANELYRLIIINNINNHSMYSYWYEYFREVYISYGYYRNIIVNSPEFNHIDEKKTSEINELFYEGLGTINY